jgi:hypothetical protein
MHCGLSPVFSGKYLDGYATCAIIWRMPWDGGGWPKK